MAELTRIVLIRHGEAAVNVQRIVGGPLGDTGLTPTGASQASRLRERLSRTREFDAEVLVASPPRSPWATAPRSSRWTPRSKSSAWASLTA